MGLRKAGGSSVTGGIKLAHRASEIDLCCVLSFPLFPSSSLFHFSHSPSFARPCCTVSLWLLQPISKRTGYQCAWPHDTRRQCVNWQASPFWFPLLSHSSPGSLPWGRCLLVKSRVSSARTRTVSVTGQVELLSLSNDPCLPSISLSR